MGIFESKRTAEKWMLNQCGENTIQKTAFVVVKGNDVIKVDNSGRASNIAADEGCYAFDLIYRNGSVEANLI